MSGEYGTGDAERGPEPAPESAAPEDCGPAGRAVELLVGRGEMVAVAESLTGGLLAAELTETAGASRAFLGSLTAYATALKQQLLDVDAMLLEQRGAVDPEVARQMARGVRTLLGADWGVATTGVAGPEPQDGQPVGTVYVAVAGPDGGVLAERLWPHGDRTAIRSASVRGALNLLCHELTATGRAKDREQPGGNGCLQP